MIQRLFLLLALVPCWVVTPFGFAEPLGSCSVVIASALVGGNWEIVMLDLSGRSLLNLTQSQDDERSPSVSPDGTTLAYAARRSQHWQIVLHDLASGSERVLASDAAYQGAPVFSPDGGRIAFESSVSGALDISVVDLATGAVQVVVADAGNDAAPQWAGPNALVYSTWRGEERFLARRDLATGATELLTDAHEEPMQATTSPDGSRVAYLAQGDGTTSLRVRPTTGGSPTTAAPTRQIAWPFWSLEQRGELFGLELSGGGDYAYPSGWRLARGDANALDVASSLPELPGQWESPACLPGGTYLLAGEWQSFSTVLLPTMPLAANNLPNPNPSRGGTELYDIDAPNAVFANDVVGSFNRLRETVRRELGYNFLYRFGDTWRTLNNESGGYTSWHKTGRAFDVAHTYTVGGVRRMYLARQVLGNQTYFRIYILAKNQDGSQGAPLRESVWEVLGRQENPTVVREGGYPLPPPAGYFVDFTDLAEREGWTRIPGLTAPDGDWRVHYNDIEFWHYERRDNLTWYAAMQQLYRDDVLADALSAEALRAHGYSQTEIERAGIPSN